MGKKNRLIKQISVYLLSMTLGCGTLIGNMGPVEEKSGSFEVADLSKKSPDWEKLPQKEDATPSTARSDMEYQSKATSSVISLISACRPIHEQDEKSTREELKSLTHPLFMGASDVTLREERELAIRGIPALQTTFSGRINEEKVKLRAVVLRFRTCVYTFVYSSLPQAFDRHEKTFAYFVSSFRVQQEK
jgi:hypothetical protein